MSEKIALIDLDGTLADFDKAMKAELDLLESPYEVNSNDRNAPWIKARKRLIKNQPGFWRNLPKIEDGFSVVELLRESGYSLNILTKGPHNSPNAWTEKAQWAQEHVPDAKITITKDKGLVYGKILFDDWPEDILSWKEWRPRGIVLMLDQVWNKDFSAPSVFRIKKALNKNSSEYIKQFEYIKNIIKNVK